MNADERHPLAGRRGDHGRRRRLDRDELTAFHDALLPVSILFWEQSRELNQTAWRERCVAQLEAGDLDGAYAELERMRAAAPGPPPADS